MVIKFSDSKKAIAKPSHIYGMLKTYFKSLDKVDRDKEHFFVFHLNARNVVKTMDLVSIGTLNQTLVHPREVFTRAIGKRTASIILAHNHPSGELIPSNDDIQVTKRLQDAGRVLAINVIDHIIFTSKGFYSFKERGDL